MKSKRATVTLLLVVLLGFGAMHGAQAQTADKARLGPDDIGGLPNDTLEGDEMYGAFTPDYAKKEGFEGLFAVALGITNGASVWAYETPWAEGWWLSIAANGLIGLIVLNQLKAPITAVGIIIKEELLTDDNE